MSHASSSAYDLSRFGWTTDLEEQFAAHRTAGLTPARIVRVDRGRCEVVTADGPLHADSTAVTDPCTGDWAALRGTRIEALLPRRTAIVRAGASRTSLAQTLAANVDTIVITVPLATALSADRLERLVALAWESGARPVIALTKADLSPDPEVDRLEAEALAPGVEVVPVAATSGAGMDALRAALTGTVVLLGVSGAGKSTLGNALLGAEVLRTGAVSAQQHGKGRHTTVSRELVPLPGEACSSTPRGCGGRPPGRRGRDPANVRGDRGTGPALPVRRLRAHRRAGLRRPAGHRGGELPERRLASYRKLERESRRAAARHDSRLRGELHQETVKRQKAISRHLRAVYGRDGGRQK